MWLTPNQSFSLVPHHPNLYRHAEPANLLHPYPPNKAWSIAAEIVEPQARGVGMQSTAKLNKTAPEKDLEASELVQCYLVVTRKDDSEVLLQLDKGGHRLLQVRIPRGQRPAPYVVSALRNRWGIQAICRFEIIKAESTDDIPAIKESEAIEAPKPHYFVLGFLGADRTDPSRNSHLAWAREGEIDWAEAEPVDRRERCYSALAQAKAYSVGALQGHFVQTGWFGDLKVWTQSQVDARGWHLSGNWEQLNMGPDFSLIRFETTGTPVWFKAVGAPNLREFSITSKLAELRSAHLPLVVALHNDWNGWLMLDAVGSHLDEMWELEHWQTAAASLARLQIESLRHSEALIGAGCDDLRIGRLRSLIEPFLHVVGQLMELQPASPPQRLRSGDLESIGTALYWACDRLEVFAIPYALGNADFNPGNILIAGNNAIFIDWAQGNIGHPFVAMEYLLALLLRLRPDLASWVAPLRESYCSHWEAVCSASQISKATEVSRLIAAFAYAVTLPGWNDDIYIMRSDVARMIRSLARRMFVESVRLRPSFVSSDFNEEEALH
jgi:hypothetical protein